MKNSTDLNALLTFSSNFHQSQVIAHCTFLEEATGSSDIFLLWRDIWELTISWL